MTPSKTLLPLLPAALADLGTLATNLWWSWSREARDLFRSVDVVLWHRTRHNPIRMLQLAEPARLAELARDDRFLEKMRGVREQLDRALSRDGTWFGAAHPELAGNPIAYFCAEFGLHNSVSIYSGGLGVLAGDHCKAASDLGVPLVAVGLLYTMGFVDQRVRLDGWQEDADDPLDPASTPLTPLIDDTGSPQVVTVPMCGRTLHVGAWRLMVGSVPVYLLDTDLEANHPDDRSLSRNLYSGGPEMRVRQEWVLGVGGVRMLGKLGIDPAAWHANEGHAAFMLVERVRQLLSTDVSLEDAVSLVRATSTFTTHTPVPAGHDVFTRDQVAGVAAGYLEGAALDPETFYSFGHHPEHDHGAFHMTAACLRLAGRVNGVSELHGDVSRRAWQLMWPGTALEDVPIGHITNGVHLATWMANPVMDLLDGKLGPGWGSKLDDPALLDRVLELDPQSLWNVHMELKAELFEHIRREARRRWRTQWEDSGQLAAAGTLMSPVALTIGFARRFATYKRADLVFANVDRLREIVTDLRRPVQILFAGKAHPADEGGKQIIQRVFGYANDPEFEGRIAFLEDYEMHLAHKLVQGVDVWLNLPLVPLEACGTSGMKAGLNGVPQLGTRDGWWAEGFNGNNGWCIQPAPPGDADAHDAQAFYSLLTEKLVPAFYERDEHGIPLGWVETMRHALRQALARFTARSMVARYATDFYVPSILRAEPASPPTAR